MLLGARADHMVQIIRKIGDMGVRVSPDAAGLWVMSTGRPRR